MNDYEALNVFVFRREQKERTEALIISPLNQLLSMFAGPHKLIQKRFDKLLDYDNCKERADRLKDKRVQDELQAARNNYEALNAQLLDELPKFHRGAEDLFIGCVRGFAQAQRDFTHHILGALGPLMQVNRTACELTTFIFFTLGGRAAVSTHGWYGRLPSPLRLGISHRFG